MSTYKAIGLMSGSSLDGLDIAYVHFQFCEGEKSRWTYQLVASQCEEYPQGWISKLSTPISELTVSQFLQLHTSYGHYLGQRVSKFLANHNLSPADVDFIATHGHTVYHCPPSMTTCQIGDGAAIAAETSLPVISDLRAMDVALGGQGAPIVPIGDRFLFAPAFDCDYLLNIGGIANITIRKPDGEMIAFDICAANQVLNALARKLGKEYDYGGKLAQSGSVIQSIYAQLNAQEFFQLPAPKSLSNEAAMALGQSVLESGEKVEDLLATMSAHIAQQIALVISEDVKLRENVPRKLLVTGGGAFNYHLIKLLREDLRAVNVLPILPEANVITFKEAIVMAFIGTLRWCNQVNVLRSVTGANRDSIGGAIWFGK